MFSLKVLLDATDRVKMVQQVIFSGEDVLCVFFFALQNAQVFPSVLWLVTYHREISYQV